jgi:hypothetical protein
LSYSRVGPFLILGALSTYVAAVFTAALGAPALVVSRRHGVQSPYLFAIAGGTIAAIAYVLLVALGMSAPSDYSMTFLANIQRPLHLGRISAAIVSGAVGSLVFWFIERQKGKPKGEPGLP